MKKSEEKNELDQASKKILKTGIWIGAFILLCWCLNWLLFPKLLLPSDIEAGQIGDIFGAVNALFSGAAFLGVIISILLQREELKAQREELVLTRNELKDTRMEFEEQNKTMKLQQFETSFYNLLKLHNENVEKFTFSGVSVIGRKIFNHFNFHSHLEETKIRTEFKKLITSHFSNIPSIYLRGLQALLELVEQTPDGNRLRYV